MSNKAARSKADVLRGTLYPALMRLEQRGPLRGKRQLAREPYAWDRMVGIIHTLLHGAA